MNLYSQEFAGRQNQACGVYGKEVYPAVEGKAAGFSTRVADSLLIVRKFILWLEKLP
jgi:hypothetical protein